MEEKEVDRIIEMAWEDRTPFEAIKVQFGFSEADVIQLMRKELKRSSFNLWRKRVNSGVSQKHAQKRNQEIDRFKVYFDEIDRRRGTNWRSLFAYLDVNEKT